MSHSAGMGSSVWVVTGCVFVVDDVFGTAESPSNDVSSTVSVFCCGGGGGAGLHSFCVSVDSNSTTASSVAGFSPGSVVWFSSLVGLLFDDVLCGLGGISVSSAPALLGDLSFSSDFLRFVLTMSFVAAASELNSRSKPSLCSPNSIPLLRLGREGDCNVSSPKRSFNAIGVLSSAFGIGKHALGSGVGGSFFGVGISRKTLCSMGSSPTSSDVLFFGLDAPHAAEDDGGAISHGQEAFSGVTVGGGTGCLKNSAIWPGVIFCVGSSSFLCFFFGSGSEGDGTSGKCLLSLGSL